MSRSEAQAAGAAVAAAALAIPAGASAHPSVYVLVRADPRHTGSAAATGNVGPYTAGAVPRDAARQQPRYVFTNHGNTYLLRESNGKTTGGAISYAHRPGAATGLAAAIRLRRLRQPPAGADDRRAAARDVRCAGTDDPGGHPQLAGHRSVLRLRPLPGAPPSGSTTAPRPGSASS